jgi:hypothetical protein
MGTKIPIGNQMVHNRIWWIYNFKRKCTCRYASVFFFFLRDSEVLVNSLAAETSSAWSLTNSTVGATISIRFPALQSFAARAQPKLSSFPRVTAVQELALYLDYRLDESYTPKQISIRAGNSFRDMTEIHAQELDEPSGWTQIHLQTQNSLQGLSLYSVACCELKEGKVGFGTALSAHSEDNAELEGWSRLSC